MLVLAVAVSVPFALDRVKARFVTELPVHADRDGFPRGELRG
jgi:hypothetical protein